MSASSSSKCRQIVWQVCLQTSHWSVKQLAFHDLREMTTSDSTLEIHYSLSHYVLRTSSLFTFCMFPFPSDIGSLLCHE